MEAPLNRQRIKRACSRLRSVKSSSEQSRLRYSWRFFGRSNVLFHLLTVGIYYYNTALCKIKVKSTKYSLPGDTVCYNGNKQRVLYEKAFFHESAAPFSKRRHRIPKIRGGKCSLFFEKQGCSKAGNRFPIRMFLWRGEETPCTCPAQGKYNGVNELRKAGSTM